MNQYILRINSNNGYFAGVIYTNFGSENQIENPIQINEVVDSDIHEYTYFGDNIVADFACISGDGELSIQVLKDGIELDLKTATAGNSIHFNIDIE